MLYLFQSVDSYCICLVGFIFTTSFLFNTNYQCNFYVVLDWYETTTPNISPHNKPIAGPSVRNVRWRLVACLLCDSMILHEEFSGLRAQPRGLTFGSKVCGFSSSTPYYCCHRPVGVGGGCLRGFCCVTCPCRSMRCTI